MSTLPVQLLFPSLLGPSFDSLPQPVRALHDCSAGRFSGEAEVRRGTGWLSRLCAWITRLPPTWEGKITVEIQSTSNGEAWVRLYGSHIMRSFLSSDRGVLRERLGPMRFWFRLTADADQLAWSVERVSLLAIPLPVALFKQVVAVESAEGDRYTFDVSATLPWIGLLVHYRGWLHVR